MRAAEKGFDKNHGKKCHFLAVLVLKEYELLVSSAAPASRGSYTVAIAIHGVRRRPDERAGAATGPRRAAGRGTARGCPTQLRQTNDKVKKIHGAHSRRGPRVDQQGPRRGSLSFQAHRHK
jgi:hypothetical protein